MARTKKRKKKAAGRRCVKWGRSRGRRVCRSYTSSAARKSPKKTPKRKMSAKGKRAERSAAAKRREAKWKAKRRILDPKWYEEEEDPAYRNWYMPPHPSHGMPGFKTEQEYIENEIREVSEVLARNQGKIP